MKHDESIIQSQIVSALSLAGAYLFMVPNDAAGKVTMAKAGRMKSMGLRAGISDLVLIGPSGTAYFMEVKTATGKLSEAQRKFMDLCTKRGWHYAVVRSVEESLDVCRKWGIL
jgi:hypothetical protein